MGYYAYTATATSEDAAADETEGVSDQTCPDGYTLSADGTACESDTQENPCPSGFKLSDDGKECISTERDLNIHTGSEVGDMAVNAAIGIASSTGINSIIDFVTKPRGVNQATASARAAKAAATKAKDAAKAAQAAASKAGAKAAAVAEAKASMLAAKAAKAAVVAGKAVKAGSLISRMASGPFAPFSVVISIIAQSLMRLLDLQPGSFESCKDGEYDLSTLPQWAQAIIGGVPLAGDLFDLFSPALCFSGGCKEGQVLENGLCYPVPKPGYKCESFLCYKQYPEWEANGMLHTFANITKAIKLDTGTIPDTPPPDTVKSGLLFYKDPGPEFNVVAGVAWEKCKAGMTDTGVRCEDIYGNGIGIVPTK